MPDNRLHTNEEYDFRQYDQVWRRVIPTLSPWGETDNALVVVTDQEKNFENNLEKSLAKNQDENFQQNLDSNLERDFKRDFENAPAILADLIEQELSQRGKMINLLKKAPTWARRNLRDLSNRGLSRVKSLTAAYYLISGVLYEPAPRSDNIITQTASWRPELRERYLDTARLSSRYARAADMISDPCLTRPLRNFSDAACADATEILRLMEKSIAP